MSCSRGKASPDQNTRLRLFADSAGYCQNPACTLQLFIDTAASNIHIAEMAHIFAATDGGPRTNKALTKVERGAYENLILLCANCHTMIDKASTSFPDSLMRDWKRDRAERLTALFGAVQQQSRAHVHALIEPLMAENLTILHTYGPLSDARFDPESEAPDAWRRKVLIRIIPNDMRILAILDKNRSFMVKKESMVVEQFRQHVDDLRARHLEDMPGGRRYPIAMNTMMVGDG